MIEIMMKMVKVMVTVLVVITVMLLLGIVFVTVVTLADGNINRHTRYANYQSLAIVFPAGAILRIDFGLIFAKFPRRRVWSATFGITAWITCHQLTNHTHNQPVFLYCVDDASPSNSLGY